MLVVLGRGFFIQLAKKMAGEIQPYTKWLDPLLRRKQVIPASSVAIVTIEKASQNVRRWAREIADESAPPECCHYISQQHEMQRWYGARLFVPPLEGTVSPSPWLALLLLSRFRTAPSFT